jgi:hypothetical protein
MHASEPLELDAVALAGGGPDQTSRGERQRREAGAGDDDSPDRGRRARAAPAALDLDPIADPPAEQRQSLSQEPLRLGELERKVAQVLAIALAPSARIRE